MIDLHMHTNYSDGTDTLTELLTKAQQANLSLISITDHDCVDAYFELNKINISNYYSGEIICGTELKTHFRGIPIEILGYGINATRIKNSEYIVNDAGSNKEAKVLEDIKKIGKGIELKFDDNLHLDEKNIFAALTFGNEIFKYEENMPIIKEYGLGVVGLDFYRTGQSNPNSIFYVDNIAGIPTPDIIINEIHEAGGLAFLAHPFLYTYENKLETIEDFINIYDIDGLECYYSLFSEEQSKQLCELCNNYDKYMSGGSDYHGGAKLDISLGIGKGNLNIPEEDINKWTNLINKL